MEKNKQKKPDHEREKKFETDSGIEIKSAYFKNDVPESDEEPAKFPFTRGIYSNMYRSQLWTMRQYAGFSTAEESNKRYHYLLKQGTKGLSVAFDLPTQIGYDSDHAMAEGEVGKVGVAIDSLKDMETLFDGIDLSKITSSMTINATASILLAMYIAVAKQKGIDLRKLSGTVQNDILKEYAARGTYIYPPEASMKIITDMFAYCSQHIPKWNTISISGYHMREAGCNAVQELAFTLSNGKAYVQAALNAGLDINVFGKRLSFFFNAHNNFFEEIAKFRAARKMWAKIMKEMGATDPKAQMLRFHTQTGGSTLTASQPKNNIMRITLQALAAVLGGTQSLHTNGYDEALSLPTENAAQLAVRTQQIIAHESGVADVADPLGGSYFIENLTLEIEQKAEKYIQKIDAMGGSVKAIETGFMQDEIANSAYKYQKDIEKNEKILVGVNDYKVEHDPPIDILRVDDTIRQLQIDKIKKLKAVRDNNAVKIALDDLLNAVKEKSNLMPFIINAVEQYATLGEISDVMRSVYGEYKG